MNQPNEKLLRFRCPTCSVILKAKPAESGQERRCPRCENKFRVPTPPDQKTQQPNRPAVKEDDALIPVICGVCNTRMYAKIGQIGTSIECPDCFTQNLVKEPQKKPKRSGVQANVSLGYDLEPKQEIEISKSLGQDLLSEAAQKIEQEIEDSPQAPNRPFLSGVFTYPLTLRVFPVVLGMTVAWSLLLIVIRLAIVLPFMVPPAAILAMMVAFPSLVSFQKMFENTSNADDEAECRPEGGLFGFIDWIGETFPLVIAILFGCLPGILYVNLARPPFEHFVVIPIAAYLLFPLFYVSMLEAASLIGLYSKAVWGSLRQVPGTWIKFYVLSGGLYLLAFGAVLAIASLENREPDGSVAAIAVGAVAGIVVLLTLYFRLLGRVVFVLSQEILVDAPEMEDSSSDSSSATQAEATSLGV